MSTIQVNPGSAGGLCCLLIHAARRAEEMQRQYLHAAACMEAEGLYVLAHALRFTSAQEGEHRAVLGGFVRLASGEAPNAASLGSACPLGAGDVSPAPEDAEALLRWAIRHEQRSAAQALPAIARAAENPRIRTACLRIAETESQHEQRFRQYLAMLEEGSLFCSPEPVGWLCLPCGCLHNGCDAPCRCDACGFSGGGFIRSDFQPFAVAAWQPGKARPAVGAE